MISAKTTATLSHFQAVAEETLARCDRVLVPVNGPRQWAVCFVLAAGDGACVDAGGRCGDVLGSGVRRPRHRTSPREAHVSDSELYYTTETPRLIGDKCDCCEVDDYDGDGHQPCRNCHHNPEEHRP